MMLVVWCVGLFIIVGPKLAGHDFVGARGDSMEPAVSSGSLLITERVSPSEVQAGDIILFRAKWSGTAMTSHRVISIQQFGESTLAITKGDANAVADSSPVILDASVVRVSKILPYAGWLMLPSRVWGITALAALMGLLAALIWREFRARKAVPQW